MSQDTENQAIEQEETALDSAAETETSAEEESEESEESEEGAGEE
jgi:hypothetical protein